MSLESELKYENEWAINFLVAKSYESDIILKPQYKLVDSLLNHFQNAASVLLPVLAPNNESSTILSDSEYEDFLQTHHKETALISQILTILINLSFVSENEKYLANHTLFVNSILNFVYGKEQEFVFYSLQIIANIASSFVLKENCYELISYLFGYLYDEDIAYLTTSIEILAKLSQIPQNHYWLAKMDFKFYQRLEELLFIPDSKFQLRVFSLLSNIAQYSSMKAKVQLAQTTTLVKHLVYFLNQFIEEAETLKEDEMEVENEEEEAEEDTKETEMNRTFITKIITTLIYLAAEMKNNPIFLPYEEHLLELSLTTTNEDYSSMLNDLCAEILSRQ